MSGAGIKSTWFIASISLGGVYVQCIYMFGASQTLSGEFQEGQNIVPLDSGHCTPETCAVT